MGNYEVYYVSYLICGFDDQFFFVVYVNIRFHSVSRLCRNDSVVVFSCIMHWEDYINSDVHKFTRNLYKFTRKD